MAIGVPAAAEVQRHFATRRGIVNVATVVTRADAESDVIAKPSLAQNTKNFFKYNANGLFGCVLHQNGISSDRESVLSR